MNKLDLYSESFKTKYEKFLIGCDSLEEIDEWDKESLGEMDIYYANDIVSVIIRLIAADGVFTGKEADYLNKIFGFAYTPDELRTVYEDCGDAMEDLFNEGIRSGIAKMRAISDKLADLYKDLLLTVCDIVIESDGVIDKAEVDLAKQLKSAVQ